ncbi:MAG: Gfo/Idh/MocA family oxidoreductase [Clostridia bacterium]|nr:Gfo/Idh/MocA family oxidoreductase [Clostridia bacterium]
MDKVRYGIVGVGNMGSGHAKNLLEGKVENAVLTAVCDINPEKLTAYKEKGLAVFENVEDMYKSGLIDCVIISVPHYLHPPFAIKAFENGIHAIVEKPTGVYTKQVKEMNEAAKKSGLVFGGMFNMRTDPVFREMKQLVESGELGEIKRTNWIMTAWYRSQSYYDSGSWRATWAGEGGGVLFNQCPHNLDLFIWITGMMPKTVTSKCYFGKWHDIEVEDDVTVFVEYENGATGVIVSSTGDAPGTNRFEIIGDKGKIVFDGRSYTFYKNKISEREFNKTFTGGFGEPEYEVIVSDKKVLYSVQHAAVVQNVTNAILGKEELLIRGEEGLNQCTFADAILLSTWQNKTIQIPFDDEEYWAELQKRIASSKVKNVKEVTFGLGNSFLGK